MLDVEEDHIAELVELKFGLYLEHSETYISARDRVAEQPDLAFPVQLYRSELLLLQSDEIQKRLTLERSGCYASLNSVNMLRDRRGFFNKSDANAEYIYWGRASTWTCDEATALLLGKDPRIVNLTSLGGLLNGPAPPRSVFAINYRNLYEAITRAQSAGELTNPITPRMLLKWARKAGLNVPEALRTTTKGARGRPNTADVDSKRAPSAVPAREQELLNEIARLKSEIKALSMDLTPKDRTSVCKIIRGVAYAKLRARSEMKISDLTSVFLGDLERGGIRLNKSTMHKWLEESGAFIPQKKQSESEKPISAGS